jgi:cardiolipin synthase
LIGGRLERRRLPSWLLAATGAMLAGCAMAPRATPPPAETEAKVTMLGSQGQVRSGPTLQAVAAEGKPDLMNRHLQALESLGKLELVRGNSAKLLIDGPATFAAMRRAIEGAHQTILLESYLFEDAGVAAEMGELLAQRARAGLKVAILRDAVGSMGSDAAFFNHLAEAGVQLCSFNGLLPGKDTGHSLSMGAEQRDHRKLLVVDERLAFTGGINISSVYGSGSASLGLPDDTEDPLKHGWRDTQIELRGPIVGELAKSFAQSWHGQACPGKLASPKLPASPEAGQRVIALMASDPREPDNRIYQSLLAAINASTHNVQLTMAYFAPGREMARALADAARRGVGVELVLPGRSDFTLVMQAGRSYYDELLTAGVHLYEMEHSVLHAKTAVIDGVWSSVGSSNMDWRSFTGNNELDVVVLGDDFGAEMQAMFERDRAVAHEITPAAWRERGIGQRLLQSLGRLLERWL